MITVADYVFPTGKFSMEADGLLVADFDVQTFGDGKWPVVATTGPNGTTWSVYEIGEVAEIRAAREQSGDGSVETYEVGPLHQGAVALPAYLKERERWAFSEDGLATYTSPTGSVEHGNFTYKNAVWAAPHNGEVVITDGDDLLYWLEQYSENYGSGDVLYERLHCFSNGEGLVAYCDLQWPGGPKWVTRRQ